MQISGNYVYAVPLSKAVCYLNFIRSQDIISITINAIIILASMSRVESIFELAYWVL